MSEHSNNVWEALKAGKEEAFRMLYDEHYLRMVAVAYGILKEEQEARDCAQEVLVRLYERRSTLQEPRSMKAYLNKATYHTALNRKKQLLLHPSSTDSYPEVPETDQHLLESAEEEARIWAAINKLPDKCRTIFLLNRFEGLNNQEIATRLDLSKRTVETQISLALKKLRKALFAFLWLP